MIWESRYWKEPLLKMALRLHKLRDCRKINERQMAKIEQDIFIGFYSIRKLIETVTKVTDATKTMQVKISWYPNMGCVNLMNNHRIEDLYDFSKVNSDSRGIVFICGRIIHSFIFLPELNEKGLSNILFTSDHDAQDRLYSMDINEVIRIFEHFGNDYPQSIHQEQDIETGKVKTVVR